MDCKSISELFEVFISLLNHTIQLLWQIKNVIVRNVQNNSFNRNERNNVVDCYDKPKSEWLIDCSFFSFFFVSLRPINEGCRINFGMKAMNQLTVGAIFLDLF